jgi:hypothetical protein
VDSIWTITVRCYPLLSDLTGNPHSKDSLQARLSAMHGVAASPCERQIGLAQYEEARDAGPRKGGPRNDDVCIGRLQRTPPT